MVSKIKIILMNFVLVSSLINAETVFIFNHGLLGNKDQIKFYKMPNEMNWEILGQRSISFDFPDVLPDGKLNLGNVNLGQDKDLEALDKVYKSCLEDETVDKIVLVGLSRGAAAAINYSSRHPEKLAALILESPFDSIEKVIEYRLQQKHVNWIPGLKFIVHKYISKLYYKGYDEKGIQPINAVKSLPKDLPILFIHSKKDTLVSVNSSRRLYRRLRTSGHKHVYLFELNHGEHAKYQFSADAKNYQAITHAFYKRYEIEHNQELADLGEQLLDNLAKN